MSSQGLYVWTEKCPAEGFGVRCEFLLPRLEPTVEPLRAESSGRVMRVDPQRSQYEKQGFAVSFTEQVSLFKQGEQVNQDSDYDQLRSRRVAQLSQ
jgi:hypothetical protein